MSRHSVIRLAPLLAVALVAACHDTGSSTPTTTTTVPSPSTSTARRTDGPLLIGVVTPRGGAEADLGAATRDGISLAVSQINTAGGVNGQPVKILMRDEGDNPATAAVAEQELVQLGVDAIVGPTSSLNTLADLDTTVDAGVLTCSPTATALALDSYPDDGLFIRTVPSDSLQAVAMSRLVEQSGNSTAAVVYLDDAFGRPLAQAVQRALRNDGTTITANVPFDGSEASMTKAISAVATAAPPVVVVIADSATGPAIVAALDSELPDPKPLYVVNDAQRRPASQAPPFGSGLAHRVIGVSPLAYSRTASFVKALRALDPDTTGLYAQNAYDCVNVIALAALTAATNDPAHMAASVSAVTSNGTSCDSFTTCAPAVLAGRNINYDGPSGTLAIDTNGEVNEATFDRFGFDDAGRDISLGTVTVTSS